MTRPLPPSSPPPPDRPASVFRGRRYPRRGEPGYADFLARLEAGLAADAAAQARIAAAWDATAGDGLDAPGGP